MKRLYTSLCLIALLVCTITSCNQTTNDNSEPVPSSSLSEISEPEEIFQPEPSSSVSESVESEENTSLPETSQPEESTLDSADASESSQPPVYTLEQERGISDFTMISDILLDYVGIENFETWAKTSYEQGKARNIKTFVDHFQIDYDTFWGIFEDFSATLDKDNPLGYPSDIEYIYNYYTEEELNALFYGDEAAIRAAFCLPDDYPVF